MSMNTTVNPVSKLEEALAALTATTVLVEAALQSAKGEPDELTAQDTSGATALDKDPAAILAGDKGQCACECGCGVSQACDDVAENAHTQPPSDWIMQVTSVSVFQFSRNYKTDDGEGRVEVNYDEEHDSFYFVDSYDTGDGEEVYESNFLFDSASGAMAKADAWLEEKRGVL